jgi:hypothetical protein
MNEPRRYGELVRDGMDDNAELVDASTKLEQDWDKWKDQNPRGSANKMANLRDKNVNRKIELHTIVCNVYFVHCRSKLLKNL